MITWKISNCKIMFLTNIIGVKWRLYMHLISTITLYEQKFRKYSYVGNYLWMQVDIDFFFFFFSFKDTFKDTTSKLTKSINLSFWSPFVYYWIFLRFSHLADWVYLLNPWHWYQNGQQNNTESTIHNTWDNGTNIITSPHFHIINTTMLDLIEPLLYMFNHVMTWK